MGVMRSTIKHICDADKRIKMINRFGDSVIRLYTIGDYLKYSPKRLKKWSPMRQHGRPEQSAIS